MSTLLLDTIITNLKGLDSSGFSLTIFADEPQVWMLYHAAILLQKDIILIIKKKDYGKYRHMLSSEFVKKVIQVDRFNDKDLESIVSPQLYDAITSLGYAVSPMPRKG